MNEENINFMRTFLKTYENKNFVGRNSALADDLQTLVYLGKN